MQLRAGAANLALASASVLLCLAAFELGARWALSHRRPVRDRVLAEYSDFDPVLGWRKRAGARARYERREYTTDVVINHQGLRDRERTYQRQPGTTRVLLLGDSHVEGYSVDFEDTIGQVLEARLSEGGCGAEAINAGTSGYSTDQELLFYQREGRRYDSDVVALFLCYNDLLFNDRGRYWVWPKPLMRPTAAGLQPVNLPLQRPPPEGGDEPDYVVTRYEGSALLHWVRERLLSGAPGLHQRAARLGLWPAVTPDEPHEQFSVYASAPGAVAKGAWMATSRLLEALAHEVARDGARFLVVYVPARMEVSDAAWELTLLRYGVAPGEWDRRAVRDRLLQVADRRGFPVLDLTPALRSAEAGAFGETYFTYDGHWNAWGHAVAAEAVETELRNRGWVPECPDR